MAKILRDQMSGGKASGCQNVWVVQCLGCQNVWVAQSLGGRKSGGPMFNGEMLGVKMSGEPTGRVNPLAYLKASLVFSLSLILSCSWTLSSWFWRELVSSSSPSPSVSARKIFLRVDSLAGCRHCSRVRCHRPFFFLFFSFSTKQWG